METNPAPAHARVWAVHIVATELAFNAVLESAEVDRRTAQRVRLKTTGAAFRNRLIIPIEDAHDTPEAAILAFETLTVKAREKATAEYRATVRALRAAAALKLERREAEEDAKITAKITAKIPPLSLVAPPPEDGPTQPAAPADLPRPIPVAPVAWPM